MPPIILRTAAYAANVLLRRDSLSRLYTAAAIPITRN